jgi:hypothetical protein
MRPSEIVKVKWLRQHRRRLLRVGGIALILIGAGFAAFWHLYLLPQWRRHDPVWQEQFTRKQYWQRAQDDIRRAGWTHDDFSLVGMLGDKGWAEWIMGKAESGEVISECGTIGHKDEALQFITCQDPAKGKGSEPGKEWLEWWKENRGKSQIEWLRDGLAAYGVIVHIPPTRDDHAPLLSLLGNTSKDPPEKVPPFVKYNAFRWLRDSGFDMLEFALSNGRESTSAQVIQGLREYSKRLDLLPSRDGVGILRFSGKTDRERNDARPGIFDTEHQGIGYSLMIIPIALGTFLLVWSTRKKGNAEPPDRT